MNKFIIHYSERVPTSVLREKCGDDSEGLREVWKGAHRVMRSCLRNHDGSEREAFAAFQEERPKASIDRVEWAGCC